MQQDIIREDVLGLLWRIEERSQEQQPILFENALRISRRAVTVAMRQLQKLGCVCYDNARWQLTESGREEASLIIRSHRLWETYLDHHFPQDTHQLHQSAERLEHVTTSTMQSQLGDAELDPHGSAVPPSLDN